jgi:tetratricopeptide (TPR) repeat protein
MKKIVLSVAFLCALSYANAQIKMPAPSPAQTVKQEFGLSNVELSYSRPVKKGRKIFGDLVPYNAVWRTGANGATTLTFGDNVIIGGKEIPAGKYGLLSIPGATSWTLIITKQTDVTSPAAYKQDQDVVRVTAKVKPLNTNVENFTIQFDNIQPESCDLVISWDKSAVSLPIKTNVDARIMASIDESMKSDKPAYFQSAFYYLESGKDLKQAETWFAKAVEAQPNAFWIRYQQARTLAKLGKKAQAKEAALKSKELANAANNQDYVTLNNKLISSLK